MNDNLSKALSIFIEAMRPFVVGFLMEHFKNEPWEGVFFARLKPDKQNTWNKAIQSLSADSDRKQLVDYNNLVIARKQISLSAICKKYKTFAINVIIINN